MSRFLVQSLSVIGLLVVPGLLSVGASGAALASERVVAAAAAPSADLVIPNVRQLPPELQQDPAARVMRMQQMRRPIVQRIKALPEASYRQVVRPGLARQLKAMGFDDQDVTYFLTDLDRTRGAR